MSLFSYERRQKAENTPLCISRLSPVCDALLQVRKGKSFSPPLPFVRRGEGYPQLANNDHPPLFLLSPLTVRLVSHTHRNQLLSQRMQQINDTNNTNKDDGILVIVGTHSQPLPPSREIIDWSPLTSLLGKHLSVWFLLVLLSTPAIFLYPHK